MFGLGSLVVHLAANTAAFSSDLGKAAHEADQRMKSIGDAAEKAGKLMSGALLAGAGTMAVLVKQAINGADATSKMAQGAGLAAEAFSELAYGMDLSGVSTEQFATSMTRLNRNISDTAANTGEAREAFAALGIQVKNADGSLKNADTIMAEVADKFAAMEDGAGKSALAVMLFGRAGAAMIPALNQGAAGMAEMREEARALGLTIDTETGRAAEQFNDNLTRLNAAKQGVANTIMRALLPQMNALTDAMVAAAKEGDKFSGIARGAVILFQTLAVLGSDVAFVFRMIGGEIGVWAAQIAAFGRGDFKGVSLIGKEWKKDSAQARVELEAFQTRIMNLGNQAQITGVFLEDVWEMGKVKPPPIAPAGEAAKIAAANRRLLEESMRGSVKAAEEMQREADELVYTWDGFGNRVTMTREEFKQLEGQAASATQTWIEFARSATEQAESMIYTWDAAGNRIQITREAFDELQAGIAKAAEESKRFDGAINSAFDRAVRGGGDFLDILKELFKELAMIEIQKRFFEKASKGLSGFLDNLFKGVGSGSAVSGSSSADMGMAGAAVMGVPAYALGTDFVPRDGLAYLHRGERVETAAENVGGGSGGVTVVQHINVDSRSDRASILQAMHFAAEKAKADIADSLNRGSSRFRPR